MLLDLIWSFLVPRTISGVFEFCRFRLRFMLCCCTCFGLTLEVCRLNSVGRDRFHLALYQDFHDSAVPNDDLVWSVAKIHASMFRVPNIGKCFSDVCRAVGTNEDVTWLPVAYQNSCLGLYVCRRCTSV